MMTQSETFIQDLFDFRREQALTQDAMSRLFGVTVAAYRHWENNRRTPPLTAEALFNVYQQLKTLVPGVFVSLTDLARKGDMFPQIDVNLEAFRSQWHLGQPELAMLLQVPPATVSRWERGGVNIGPVPYHYLLIIKHLGVFCPAIVDQLVKDAKEEWLKTASTLQLIRWRDQQHRKQKREALKEARRIRRDL